MEAFTRERKVTLTFYALIAAVIFLQKHLKGIKNIAKRNLKSNKEKKS